MKLAIMQPYFLPYIGYWQLLSAVDTFILYDNIQYTKKGWINRNRFLQNGRDALFTVPLKKASDFLHVCCRSISEEFNRDKVLHQLEASYRRAPQFHEAFPIVESIIRTEKENLFEYIDSSIRVLAEHLGITTPIVVSSTVGVDHSLCGEHKVIALCQAMRANRYINAIGGQGLYSRDTFAQRGIELSFLQTSAIVYRQFDDTFVSNLSIVDVLMFNDRDTIRAMLGKYDLI